MQAQLHKKIDKQSFTSWLIYDIFVSINFHHLSLFRLIEIKNPTMFRLGFKLKP